MAKKYEISVLGVGDLVVNREDPDSMFAHCGATLRKGDITFGQLETNYTERGAALPQARLPLRAPPKNATALKNAGFDVVSYAANHHMDWGAIALTDTIALIKQLGIKIIGAGENIEAARKPPIFDVKGTKIAFLAYSSILPIGYWAEANRPGAAPLRAWTVYEEVEPGSPGLHTRVHTFANKADKAAMLEDVKKAKAKADVLIMSCHWGVHFKHAEIADYEKEIAYEALDAGVDAIFGHHAHILKGIEVYKGKPIFYNLGNFAFDNLLPESWLKSPRWREMMLLRPEWKKVDMRYRSYPFPADSRMTIIAKLVISGKKIRRASFYPCMINRLSQPKVLTRKTGPFNKVAKYMQEITRHQNINTKFAVDGDEVVVQL